MLANPILTFLPQIIGGALALLGLGAALWFIVGSRARHATCRRCGYDTSGQLRTAQSLPPGAAPAPLTCPECGTTVASQAAWLARRRPSRWVLGIAVLLLLGAPISATWPSAYIRAGRLVTSKYKITDSVTFGPFTAELRTLNWPYEWLTVDEAGSESSADFFTISTSDGSPVVAGSRWHGSLGVKDWAQPGGPQTPATMALVGRGTDITGDGIPDLAVDDSGFASGNTVTVYSYATGGGKPEITSTVLKAGCLHDFDGDGVAEFVTHIPAFKFAWTARFEGTEPVLVLRRDLASGEYSFDAAVTRAYNAPALASLAGSPPVDLPSLVRQAVTLLASGDGDRALELVRTHGEAFKLSESVFRTGIISSIRDTPVAGEWLAAQPESFRTWLGPVK